MNWLKRKRIKQVMQYGWQDAKVIAPIDGKSRLTIWFDIIGCFRKYYLFSNQYKSKEVWKSSADERGNLAKSLGEKNRYRDDWTVWKYENAAFIDKYSSVKYGSDPNLYNERLKEYMRRYNMGEGSSVSNNVTIERNHYLEGSIKIGKNVMLSKNVFIDYSGELIIQDDVALANGVIIETHTHLLEKKGAPPAPGRLVIEKGVKVLSRAYIADTCHFIGRYARIGAGTYIRGNVLPYSIMIGNPAKIVGFMYSPEEVEEFEKNVFPEGERIDVEKYSQDYKKYFIDRRNEIKGFLQK